MSTPAKTNGRTRAAVCRHSPGCEVVTEQRDLRVIVETMMRDLREQRTTLESSLMQMQERIDRLNADMLVEGEKTRAEMRALLREVR